MTLIIGVTLQNKEIYPYVEASIKMTMDILLICCLKSTNNVSAHLITLWVLKESLELKNLELRSYGKPIQEVIILAKVDETTSTPVLCRISPIFCNLVSLGSSVLMTS